MKTFILSFFILVLSLNVALAGGDVVISKVRISGGTGKSAEDFVEIQNQSSQPVNLNGYRIVKRTAVTTFDVTLHVFETDVVLQPGGSFTWANGSLQGSDVVSAQAYGTATISTNNGVGLRKGAPNSGELVSSIAWGKANNGFVNVFEKNPAARQVLSLQSSGKYTIAGVAALPKAQSKTAKAAVMKKPKTVRVAKAKVASRSMAQVQGTATEVLEESQDFGAPVIPLWAIVSGFGGVLGLTYVSLKVKKKFDVESHVQEV